LRGEPTTIGMLDFKPICYTTRLTSPEQQTDHIIRAASCEVVRWNKF